MVQIPLSITRAVLAVTITSLAGALPAHADKPPWAGNGGKHGQSDARRDRDDDRDRERRGGHDEDRHGARKHARFVAHDRVVIREYYVEEHRRGFCPPGLAKKHNGCMPPGQARRWPVGKALPRDVVYYPLPPQLVVRIGTPPPGYQYVRVATDILLIAVGTRLVVDAIRDLGRG